MKANRKSLLANDTRAQVGIGTMIVFIATILVAATAAAVLIDTSGKLQERSSSTGNEATKQVASNLVLVQAIGNRTGTTSSDNVENLTFTVTLAPGASQVDLQQLKIRITDGTDLKTFDYVTGTTPTGTNFAVDFKRDHDGTEPVMIRGDLANVIVNLNDTNGASMEISARDEVGITFVPEIGSQLDASFTAPSSYGSDTEIVLR